MHIHRERVWVSRCVTVTQSNGLVAATVDATKWRAQQSEIAATRRGPIQF